MLKQTIVLPYYLITHRGFYCGSGDVLTDVNKLRTHLGFHIYTANIRKATPFTSFDEAEKVFRDLLSYSRVAEVKCKEFFAVVNPAIHP